MSDDRRTPPTGQEEEARIRLALRTRALLKIVLVTIVFSQVLVMLFGMAAQTIDPGVSATPSLIFGYVTCALVSYWLQADARRAWEHARERGHVRRGTQGPLPGIEIAAACPRRWLVILYAELNPAARA
ncbi:hypothetical protein [Paraburkholderia acidipaludis]|uniref:hypothetical protein n=1 Tax=Paraburkholderia acidipaludis TaxID=660537 RepID=UPI0005B84818|nr:hypothetical protein [Paraburkholderia acidipaludis]